MIVIAILGILAAVVVPMMGSTNDMARVEAMASNVNHVRTLVLAHAGSGDVPLSLGGYPTTIDPAWFRGGKLPTHAWTDHPIVVEVVNAAATIVYPAVKAFDPSVRGAFTAWYNASNGKFCARVPAKPTDAETLEIFNQSNKTGATVIGQTTN